MHTRILISTVFTFFIFGQLFSQENLQLTSKDSLVSSSWMVGLGYNIIDDSGDAFNDFLTVKDQWNMVAFPSRLSVGRYFNSGIGIELIGTYNKYKEGNIIDGVVNPEDIDYFGIDSRLSYDLNKLIGNTGWFDPYVGVGLGYSDVNNVSRGTYNAIIGFRTWFSDRWGLDLNSSGKWAMGNNGATNYIQHAAGVVYRFGIEKELSKKGQEKLALINDMEKERQRVQDSIATANRKKEEALLAARLAEEKERQRLADAEKARLEAENQRKSQIEREIKEMGLVYFDLNSSFIKNDSKLVLDKLVTLMQETPELELRVTSHTDSRGTATYNQWLSEKRVENTVGYLIGKGVEPKRLDSEAFGESQLLNDCTNGTYCTEKQHKINRRSEFIPTKI